MGDCMKTQAARVLAGLGLVVLASCTDIPLCEPGPSPLVLPPLAAQDRTDYNNQQVALFASHDPGWQAWLNAMAVSEGANNAVVDASRSNTSVTSIIQAITNAQDAYRVATSFDLTPFTVTSRCRNLYSETNGHVQLVDGLTIRYGFVATEMTHFENGLLCVVSVGVIDEVDSSRGLPIATVDLSLPINWSESFSRYLVWHQPYRKLSTDTNLSLPDLVDLIEK